MTYEEILKRKLQLGPKAKDVEYVAGIDDLRRGIIAVSAILNKYPSATLYFDVKNDGQGYRCTPIRAFDKFFQWYGLDVYLHAAAPKGALPVESLPFYAKDFIIDEIRKAISPCVEVKFEVEKRCSWRELKRLTNTDCLPNAPKEGMTWEQIGDFGVMRFTITGGKPPYSAYGQYYMRRGTTVCPLQSSRWVLPDAPKKPVVNIGPKSKQTVYIESFEEIAEGIAGVWFIQKEYPYVMIYVGVKEDGTVIDPRTVEETEADITDNVMHFVGAFAARLTAKNEHIDFNADKINGIGVVQLAVPRIKYHGLGNPHLREKKGIFDYIEDTPTDQKAQTKYTIYSLESPAREVTFETLTDLLAAKGISWEDFQAKIGVPLYNDEERFNLFSFLIGDNVASHLNFNIIIDDEQTLKEGLEWCEFKRLTLFDGMNYMLDYVQRGNQVWTKVIDGTEVQVHQYDFEDLRQVFLYACMHHDWTNLDVPVIETTENSIDVIFYPIAGEGDNLFDPNADDHPVPKENEILVKLMKLWGVWDGEQITLSKIREKYGPWFYRHEPNGYLRIKLPVNSRPAD